MKQFFKFMFASFVGTLLTFLIIFLIFVGMIAGIVAMTEQKEVKVEANSILHIKWETPIKDRAAENPFENFDFGKMEPSKPLGLNVILKTLDKAKDDPNIVGIVLNMETIPAGTSTTEEIRNKMAEFKESGKFIYSYAENYDQKAYFLASLADEIYLNPEGMILFKGLNVQVAFLKGLLEKIDVEMQVVRGPNNKYKSAVEPLMLDKMSAANREQIQTLANSIWGKILLALSKSRGISVEDLNNIADNLDLTTAQKALELKFIDGITYRDELITKLMEKTGVDEEDDLEWVGFGKYIDAKSKAKTKKRPKDRIAVVYAQGSIVSGKGGPDEIGSATMAKAVREARQDEDVKAIVFRVNSGGGSALASEVIRREVELATKEKPVIVSMGDVAASGGYWISTNADYIFAQPTTITGSIGVFGVIPNFQGLFNDKLGITFDKVMTNKNADFIDVMEPMKPFQYKKLNESIIHIYESFIQLVATTRDLDPDYVDGIAKGRVWSGTDALELGLVDQLGGLEDAVNYAAEKAELGEKYRINEYPIQLPFFEQLIKELTGETKARIIGDELGEFKTYYDHIQTIRKMEGVQARLPFFYEIN